MRDALSLLMLFVAAPAAAQVDDASQDGGGIRLGIFGFSARVGVDFEGNDQVVVAQSVDLGHLLTNRLRFRPSVEVGVGGGPNTFVGNAELIFRVVSDAKRVVPYLGGGFAIATQEGCSSNPDCPTLWAQLAVGVEFELRDRIAWLLEYHGEDALSRHRFLVGFTTRRGS